MSNEVHDPEGGVAVPTHAAEGESPWKRRALVIGLAATACSIAALVLIGMNDGAVYAKPVDELLAQRAKFIGRPVRLEGNLVHGSLLMRESPCEYRFRLERGAATIEVRYPQCVVPDTFRDVPDMDVGVTTEGQLQADGTFLATSVLAKCPSKYEMKDREKRGEKAPHTASSPRP